MICPHCDQELRLANNNAFINADRYQTVNRVLTTCCDQFVLIEPIRHFNIKQSFSRDITDDWGNEKVNKNVWIRPRKRQK